MPGSVELTTIWLVDLVGSTQLATSVGPVRADQLRHEYFTLLRQAVEAGGGHEFKNTGDGLIVAFKSASAAVSCAVVTQQLFERRYRGAEQQLHVRIGLGTGESMVEDGDYFGMPTVEAARLCDKASADGILVSSTTKLLAGRVDGARFEPAGALELKGIPEPVEAFSVAWEPLDPERAGVGVGTWPLPEALRTVPSVAFVGRLSERDQIEQIRSQARSGMPRLLLLSGEPGIGKTRLASYSALASYADGFAVCWGACSEDLAVPYEPWIHACSQLVANAPQEQLQLYVERFGGELSRLTPSLSLRVPGVRPPQASDPETERFLLFASVAGLLQAVCDMRPLCLVLDDLHWTDGQTVALLKHVVRTIRTGGLQVIVTYRDSELTGDHPLTLGLADLLRAEGVNRIALRGLGAEDVVEMMSAAAGHAMEAQGVALAGEIAGETGGNPFFVAEILRSLLESGTFVFDEGSERWRIETGAPLRLPPSVRDVVGSRAQRLGPEALEVLLASAVVGNEFEVALVTELVDVPEMTVLDLLEVAVAASILTESPERVGWFAFAHALIRQSLYESLGATRRARMHHRVATALEQLKPDERDQRLAELALHWRLATISVEVGKAAEYARRAGEQALARLAPGEAARFLADAVELIGTTDDAERCRALVGLGEAQRQMGDAAYRNSLLEASRLAYELQDAQLAADAALANNRGSYSVLMGVDHERLEAIERALELAGSSVPIRRARLLALQAQELLWDADSRRRWALADEAMELARAAGDPRGLALVLRNAGYALWAPDTLAQRLAIMNELSRCAEVTKDPALLYWAHLNEFNTSFEAADLTVAEVAIERCVQLGSELGQPLLDWGAVSCLVGFHLERGDFATCEREAERAFALGQQAEEPDAVVMYAMQISQLRTFQGRADEVIELLEQGVAQRPHIAGWRGGLAHAYVLLGRHAEAVKILDASLEELRHLPRDSSTTISLAAFAAVAGQTRARDACAELYDLIEPWQDTLVWTGATGLGHFRMWRALLAATLDLDERADADFAFACEFQETNGMLFWAAYAHVLWGEAFATRGESGRAQAEGARALALAREHGYGAVEARAAALASSATTASREA